MQELIQASFIKINGQVLSVYIQEFYCLKEALSMFVFWINYADIVYYKQNWKNFGNNISRGFSVLHLRYHENIRLINVHTSCIYFNKEERKEENKKENTVVSHCDKRDVAKPFFFLQIVTEIEMLFKIAPAPPRLYQISEQTTGHHLFQVIDFFMEELIPHQIPGMYKNINNKYNA